MFDFIRAIHAKLFQWYKGSITALSNILHFQEVCKTKFRQYILKHISCIKSLATNFFDAVCIEVIILKNRIKRAF